MRLLYVIGEPGTGKTSLLRALTAPLGAVQLREPVPHIAFSTGPRGVRPHAAEIGARRGTFSGTDALAMNAQPAVLRWLEQAPYPLLLAEGDRLGNDKFFSAVLALGIDLTLLRLVAPAPTLAARLLARGSEQNPAWLQGRRTKVARLAAAYDPFTLETRQPPMLLAQYLRGLPGPLGSITRQLLEGNKRERANLLDVRQPDGDGAPTGLSVGAEEAERSAADADDTATQADA